ncbi:MAG: DUF4870 domain-containing protein [Phycisphaerales bacterium]|nr:DUF4870 domain-containing protein [Phycisphaerales bacterium]
MMEGHALDASIGAASEPAMSTPGPQPERTVDAQAGEDERGIARFVHLAGLANLLSSGVPFLGVLATVIMWRVNRTRSPFLDDHGRDATNFQITLLIYTAVGSIFIGLLGLLPLIEREEVFKLGAAFLIVLQLVGNIRGAKAGYRGEYYRYPMTFRLIPEDRAA